MPCNAAPTPEFSLRDLQTAERKLWRKINQATRVACCCVKLLRKLELFKQLSKSAQRWAKAHDQWDASRDGKVGTWYSQMQEPLRPNTVTNGGPVVPGGKEYESTAMESIETALLAEFDLIASVVAEAGRVLRTIGKFNKLPKETQAWAVRHEDWDTNLMMLKKRLYVRKKYRL